MMYMSKRLQVSAKFSRYASSAENWHPNAPSHTNYNCEHFSRASATAKPDFVPSRQSRHHSEPTSVLRKCFTRGLGHPDKMLLSAARYSAVITVFALTMDWLLLSLGLLISAKIGNLWFADAMKRWGVVDYLRESMAMARGTRVEQMDEPLRDSRPRKPVRQRGVAKTAMFGFFVIMIARRLLSFGDVVLLSLGPTEDQVSVSQSSGSDECTIGLPGLVATSGNRSEVCVTTQNGGGETSTEELCSQSAYGLPTEAGGYEGIYLGFGLHYGYKYPLDIVATGDARLSAFTGWTEHYIRSGRAASYSPNLMVYSKDGGVISDESGSASGLLDDTIAMKDLVVVNGSDVAQLTLGARKYELRFGFPWETGTTAMGLRIENILSDYTNLTGVVLDVDEIGVISESLATAALEDYDGPSELLYRTASRISHGNAVLHSLSSVIEITFSYYLTTDDEFYFQMSDVNFWEVYSYSVSLSKVGPYLSEWSVKACDSNFNDDELKFRGSAFFYCSGNTFDSTLGDVISGENGEQMLLVLDEKNVYMDNGGIYTASVITLPEGLSEIISLGDHGVLYEDPDGSIISAGLSGSCSRRVAVTENLYVVNVWYLLTVSVCIAIAALLAWWGLRNTASVYKASPWDVVGSQMLKDDRCQASRRNGYLEVTPLSHEGQTYISVGGNLVNTTPGKRVEGVVVRSKRDTCGVRGLDEMKETPSSA